MAERRAIPSGISPSTGLAVIDWLPGVLSTVCWILAGYLESSRFPVQIAKRSGAFALSLLTAGKSTETNDAEISGRLNLETWADDAAFLGRVTVDLHDL